MNSVNLSTLLLLAGLAALLINVGLSAARLRRGQLRAGLLNVGLAFAACTAITVGIVQITYSAPAQTAAAPAPAAASTNGVVQPVSAKSSDSAKFGSVPSAAEVTAMAQGSVPDPLKTAAANGKAPAAMMTAAAAPNGASTTSTTTAGSSNLPRLASLFTAAGAVVVILAGLLLFQRERRRSEFNPSNSHGLLSVGAGVFTVVAVLVIPLMAAPTSAQASGAIFAAAQAQAQTTPTVSSRVIRTATPSVTPVPSLTPTEPPTLTPESSETPIVLYTPIPYTSTYSADMTTNCTVTAITVMSLRGDPSTDQQAIGRVFAGSLLPVTGQSADQKWWRVVNDDLGSRVEGWVSAAYVKADSTCFDGSVPVIGASGAASSAATSASTSANTGATATTTAKATLTLTATTAASATPAATSTPTVAVETVADCTVMTISAASLRTGPGKSFVILGQVPDRTALTATEKSVDGQWFHVRYDAPDGTKDGWIASSLVMASTTCQHLASVTLTPTGL